MTLFVALSIGMLLATLALLTFGLRRGAPRVAIAVALLVPVLVGGLYLLVGTPAALDPAAIRAPDSLEDAVSRLEGDLQRDPRQPEGWLLLGRAYAGMDRLDGARDAIGRAARLMPEDDGLQVEYAQARANADPQRRFDAAAVQGLRAVLERNPEHQHARWFLGIAQRQAGDDAGAAATWTPLLAQLDAGTAATLRAQIDVARTAAGLTPLEERDDTPAVAPTLRVRVQLDDAARARVEGLPEGAQVFVIARQADGGPMPVAVQRHPLAALPLDIVLDDGDGPMPTQRLSALDTVDVIARISVSGSADRGEGDLESAPVRVHLPAREPVDLRIRAGE